jgi:5-amino-6-(5-phospho-D-ribitylamino)uracil phosphatase
MAWGVTYAGFTGGLMLLPARGRSRFRILALDADGTLLDGQGQVRPRTAEAVARAARAGIRPVLCTGRRYRRAWPVALELGFDAPVVCNSGALVKDPHGHQTLWRADFDADLLALVLELFATHDQPAVSFTDRTLDEPDFLAAQEQTGRPFFDEFVALNRSHAEIDPGWLKPPHAGAHFHLCALGSRPGMLDFQVAIQERLGGRVRTFVQKSPRYNGTMCEVLRADASKWSAVLHLAALWNVGAAEICAVGDDMNDIPMIAGAGLGVAMGHAPPEVRAAARLITGSLEQDGVAALVDEVLLP